jgi:hypothetical protein
VTSPDDTLNTVCRRLDLGFSLAFSPPPPPPAAAAADAGSLVALSALEAVGGGGGTENRARSWDSVSRMREVMSSPPRRAFVKILEGGKLCGTTLS